jgi:hypothetical protein
MLRVVAVFVGAAVFMVTLFQSLAVTVDWWRGRITELTGWELFWLLLLPVLLAVYLHGLPLFRRGCPACPPDEARAPEAVRQDAGP